MTHFTYAPQGVCSKQISFDIENNQIHNIHFIGGCPGNLQAIAKLAEGKNPREIADILRYNDCHGKGTSCADQLARAIDQALSEK